MASMREFKVLELLGKGSYGSVYKYAVKEVNIRKLSAREREDAVNEIRVMASIEHEYIVRYREAFVERDNLFIVMEFAEHGDVHNLIKKFKQANKYIKEDTIWSYLLQVCHGLAHLHKRSILHRDIKPKNIFLAAKNHIRLGDLGCAKLMKTGLARTQIGTPYYMSPEIWANRPYDDKSDMWAVGCFVYELCALSPPFLANDMNGLARKVKSTPAPRISRHYSDELADLVAAMLDKNPRTRPSAAEVLAMAGSRKRMHLLPVTPSGGASKELLATIKMPANLYALKHQLALPGPAYSPAAGAVPVSARDDDADREGPDALPPSGLARAPSPITSPARAGAPGAAAGGGGGGGGGLVRQFSSDAVLARGGGGGGGRVGIAPAPVLVAGPSAGAELPAYYAVARPESAKPSSKAVAYALHAPAPSAHGAAPGLAPGVKVHVPVAFARPAAVPLSAAANPYLLGRPASRGAVEPSAAARPASRHGGAAAHFVVAPPAAAPPAPGVYRPQRPAVAPAAPYARPGVAVHHARWPY